MSNQPIKAWISFRSPGKARDCARYLDSGAAKARGIEFKRYVSAKDSTDRKPRIYFNVASIEAAKEEFKAWPWRESSGWETTEGEKLEWSALDQASKMSIGAKIKDGFFPSEKIKREAHPVLNPRTLQMFAKMERHEQAQTIGDLVAAMGLPESVQETVKALVSDYEPGDDHLISGGEHDVVKDAIAEHIGGGE